MSSIRTYSAAFSAILFILIALLLSSCDSPSNGLDEQGESSQTLADNIATAQSMGYNVTLTDLGPGFASAINDAGQIVGRKEIEEGVSRAFLWEDGEMTILEPLPGDVQSSAVSINNNGRVIGYSDGKPLSWRNGKLCRLCILEPEFFIIDINDNGQILGRSSYSKYFILENEELTYFIVSIPPLPFGTFSMNNKDVVAGTREFDDPQNREAFSIAFIWSDENFRSLGLGFAFDINDKNQVVGRSDAEAFLWDKNNGDKSLGTLGGDISSPNELISKATGINNKSQVVGVSTTPSGEWHLFLWENDTIIDLGISTKGPNDFSINNNGQIAGVIRDESGVYHIVLIEIEKN